MDKKLNVLTPYAVETIFNECSVKVNPGDNPAIKTFPGIQDDTKFHLDTVKLASYKDCIIALLLQLPEEFIDDGTSFKYGCLNKNREQWTGIHHVAQKLFLLGMGIDMVCYSMPRKIWKMIPGGLPFFTVLSQPDPVTISERNRLTASVDAPK